MTIHLIYPHGPSIACPDAIGRNLAEGLQGRFDVRLYDWQEREKLSPDPGDVLMGHPSPLPGTIFRRSIREAGWRRTIALAPYAHGSVSQMAWAQDVIPRCDLFLAITGEYWFSRIASSSFSHWLPKMIRVDLAVDQRDFPPIKHRFAAPGQRRFLYIGSDHWTKNLSYLSAIAAGMPESEIGWIGEGDPVSGLRSLGKQDFRTDRARALVAEFDFLITVGRTDAAPATILEAMGWGLIPICTPQSGYEGSAGIVNIPLNDLRGAMKVLTWIQGVDEAQLLDWQRQNRIAIEEEFTWKRFTDQAIWAIETTHSPPVSSISVSRRLGLRAAALRSSYAWWRPRQIRAAFRASRSRRTIDEVTTNVTDR